MIESQTTKDAISELGLKMTSKRAQKLEQIKEKCEEDLLAGEIEKMISEEVIKLMNRELEKEGKKFK